MEWETIFFEQNVCDHIQKTTQYLHSLGNRVDHVWWEDDILENYIYIFNYENGDCLLIADSYW